jgi:hypothetical protein
MSNNICRNFKDKSFPKNYSSFLTKNATKDRLSRKIGQDNGLFPVLQQGHHQAMLIPSRKKVVHFFPTKKEMKV